MATLPRHFACQKPNAVHSRRHRVIAQAKGSNPLPPDTPKEVRKGGREWLTYLFNKFGPVQTRDRQVTTLDFEKPLVELDNRINEVRRVAEENSVDVTEQIKELENRAQQLRRETYSRLTPTQKLQVARHPNRPTFLDIALNVSEKFVELHGDRAGLDDPAIVCGLANIDGVSMMFIGHQKGRNTKENIYRNFGMPTPNGYRKALRFMKLANKLGMPIVTFVDTPGAYAGKSAEELGQGEAIAVNLREMFGFRVPIISLVIGEGGSGGALAIGCANRSLIMENAVYYVASPEACAAILWKSREKAPTATEALRITSNDLLTFGIMDEVVPEPLGASHTDPMAVFPAIREAIMSNYRRYANMSAVEIQADRYAKFRKIGLYEDFLVRGGQRAAALAERAEAPGATTKAGTECATAEEAELVELLADADARWAEMLATKQEWTKRPVQPRPLQQSRGLMHLAGSAVAARRQRQGAGAAAPAEKKTEEASV
ncbi:unnamed protein product [Pedinophyceae sp. YPF-701]|nr:unnamed protein product [Pedinophyceae sp. YPF-701]